MTETMAALTKMLSAAKADPPLLINMDAAGEYTSAEFLSELDKRDFIFSCGDTYISAVSAHALGSQYFH